MGQPIILICQPVEFARAIYPGSIQLPCHRCGTPLWVAPSGQKLKKLRNALISCPPCAVSDGLASAEELTVTSEALDEIQLWRRRN